MSTFFVLLPLFLAWCATISYAFVISGILPAGLFLEQQQKNLPVTVSIKKKWNLRCPKWYCSAQILLVALTFVQSVPKLFEFSSGPAHNNGLQLLQHVRLFAIIKNPAKLLAAGCLIVFTFFLGSLFKAQRRRFKRPSLIFLNLVLYSAILFTDCAISHSFDCQGAPIFSGMPLFVQLKELSRAWKHFHQIDFFVVRLSHALTYLPILLCLTRKNGEEWARWRVFMLFIPDFVADLAHFASSPLVAAERMQFDEVDLCGGIDRHFLRTAISFPLNWLFLSTPLGRLN
mmetsp:Transcript_15327/g.23023  ORF Transcript_15327/g.23023 Transcript_15327/m.23023 type:complete len:287 (-) Transcript_15327:242-1102(-)